MPQYLINIAVGPVQNFIASARKLRDLWYGSYLLSERSKAVARSLQEQGCTLIFPAVNPGSDELRKDSEMNVANKILALTPEGVDPEEMIDAAQQTVTEYWEEICTTALNKAKGQKIDKKMFAAQVKDFGEFYAAWIEYDSSDYLGCKERCEKRLAGRKSLRMFTPPAWNGDGKRKSSLDGVHESVFSQESATSYLVKKGEELDALGIVKRFGPLATRSSRRQFDSLPEVAAQPYLEGLQKAALKSPGIAGIVDNLPKVEELYPAEYDRPRETKTQWSDWPEHLSSEILFPSVVKAEINLRKDDKKQEKIWEDLEDCLKQLWSKTREPLPYCCLLVGDGDDMGEKLKSIRDIEHHQKFSAGLDSFARDMHPLLERHHGRVVYSGGDDVMAYVPLHKALDCARAINQAFGDAMQEACKATGVGTPPTFSMGMVIVHLHKPLHQALELARDAEKLSKKQPTKNSLTLIQSKRGGTDITVTGQWDDEASLLPLVDQLTAFTKQYKDGKLPSRLGYQLRAITKECGERMEWKAQPDNVCATEALRVVSRKRQQTGQAMTTKEAADLLTGHKNLRELSDRLIVSQLISRAHGLAAADYLADKEGGAS